MEKLQSEAERKMEEYKFGIIYINEDNMFYVREENNMEILPPKE